MSDCQGCVKCTGVKVPSTCIVWEGKEIPYDSFNAVIEFLYDKATTKAKEVDLKTLATICNYTQEDALQIVIDELVKQKYAASTTASSSGVGNSISLNISAIDGCSTCNKSTSEKLQALVDEVVKLRAEVNQLKQLI